VHCNIRGCGHAVPDKKGSQGRGARYDPVEVACHWTTAALVVTLYLLAQA
jgi:hypothetical protein